MLLAVCLGIIAGVTPEKLAGFCADEDVERGSSVVRDVGTGNFTLHDNDFFVSGNRANSFGFHLNGQVSVGDGARHHVSAAFQGIATRQGDLRIVKTQIVLR